MRPEHEHSEQIRSSQPVTRPQRSVPGTTEEGTLRVGPPQENGTAVRAPALSPVPAPRRASLPSSSPSLPAQSQSLERRHNGLLQRAVHPHLHMHFAAGECPHLFSLLVGGEFQTDTRRLSPSIVAAGVFVRSAINQNVCKVAETTEIVPDVAAFARVAPTHA